jgi:hypothetical protein
MLIGEDRPEIFHRLKKQGKPFCLPQIGLMATLVYW